DYYSSLYMGGGIWVF
nr:immunoglobulin light chain junction region [Macaca mulatta]MOW30068.1 immunoglobulin light chain junction region [Macaca mulatta]